MTDDTMTITPRKVEWTGPQGWTVWADEDGVHVRTPKGDGLEQPDLLRLIDLVDTARDAMQAGQIPAPAPLTKEAYRELHYLQREEYAARRAMRAVQQEFEPDEGVF